MSKKKNKDKPKLRVVADNRRARFDYELGDAVEAGLQLLGTEVKGITMRNRRNPRRINFPSTKRSLLCFFLLLGAVMGHRN